MTATAGYLTVQDVADELKVKLRTAYTYVSQMRHLKMGRNVRVSRASFEAWKRDQECRESSGNESPVESTGQTSEVAASPPSKGPSVQRARGRQARNSMELIHVSQPRKRRASPTPS